MAADEKPGAGFCFVADYQAGIQHGLGKPRPGPPGSSRRAGGSSSVLRPTRARVDSWLFGYSIVPKWSTFWDTTLLFERHVSGSTPRPEAEQRMLPVLGFCRGVDKTCCVPNASFLGRWNSQRAKSCSRLLWNEEEVKILL